MQSRWITFAVILAALVALAALTLYVLGYRFADGFKLQGSGAIELTNLSTSTSVFLDGKRLGLARDTTWKLRFNVAGPHDVLAAKDGYWPWMKTLMITSGEITVASPFIIPTAPEFRDVPKALSEYEVVNSRFESITPPSNENRRISLDNEVSLWIDGNTLRARLESPDTMPPSFCIEACDSELTVFVGREDLRQADFFGGRNDVAIIAIGDGIYAIELDKRDRQNFQPIFKGAAPTFVTESPTSIFVKDGERIVEVSL